MAKGGTRTRAPKAAAAEFKHDALAIRTVNPGKSAIAAALGPCGTAKAGDGGAIVLAYFDTERWPYVLKHIGAFMVGQDGIEAGKTYRLGEDGKPVEIKQ